MGEICAPASRRKAAKAATCGSAAALRITVSPRAQAAAKRRLAVAPTEGIANAVLDYVAFDGEAIFDVPAMLLDIRIEELNTLLGEVLCNQDSFVLSTVYPMEETEERSTT